MKDKTKKGLIVATGIALSAVLIFFIAKEMQPKPVIDEPLPQTTEQETDVVVDDTTDTTEKEEITVPPINVETTDEETSNGDDTGTEQTIQPDPESKPEITEEQRTDSTQTPDGVQVTPPTQENPNPPQTQVPETQPAPTEPSNPTGGLPGFDNVPNLGENQGGIADSDGDINTQVGIMGGN